VGRPTFLCSIVTAACLAQAVSPPRAAAGFLGALFGGDEFEEACVFEDVTIGEVEAGARDVVVPLRKRMWELSLGSRETAKLFVRSRLRGWPAQLVADRATLPANDEEFLRRLAADTWRGLDAFTHRANGLPLDNVRFLGASTDLASTLIGDYTNVTNIGLQMIAIAAAHQLGLVERAAALARLERLLATLGRLESHRGFFFNYYDTTSMERTSNFISFVDSSWLTAGLIVARTLFAELHAPCTRLIEAGDYRFFYDPRVKRMSHGYYVHLQARSRYHYGVLFAESRLGSLIAIGKGEAPEEHWFRMVRTFPAACAWQTRPPQARRRKQIDGHQFSGGCYDWLGARYVPSWGGSMFEALMPALVLDELRHAPRSLGENARVHAEVQRRWALERLAYPVWGMSSSSTADGKGYSEYGVSVLGSAGYKDGVVAPYAAALALAVAPAEATANLRRLAERYDAYGEYGLYDAVDPRSGQVAHAYLALDQAMTFIALANHLSGGAIQNAFASDPIVQRALPVIAKESFFD
jgi:hypothetical protein